MRSVWQWALGWRREEVGQVPDGRIDQVEEQAEVETFAGDSFGRGSCPAGVELLGTGRLQQPAKNAVK